MPALYSRALCVLILSVSMLRAGNTKLDTIDLTAFDVVTSVQSYGALQYNKSVDGKPMSINGISYSKGFGTNTNSTIEIYVSPRATQLNVDVGLDDETLPQKGTATFLVLGDGVVLWSSGRWTSAMSAIHCKVNLHQVRHLSLVATDAEDGTSFDHVNWCNPQLTLETEVELNERGCDTTLVNIDDVLSYYQEYGLLQIDSSIEGTVLSIAGTSYSRGLGTHASSAISVFVNPRSVEFRALVGLDDNTLPDVGSVEFFAIADNDTVWRSGFMRTGDSARLCRVCLEGRTRLQLIASSTSDGNSFDHADWVQAQLISWKALAGEIDTIALTNVPFDDAKENINARHQVDVSVGKTTMQIGSRKFKRGLGAHANFLLPLALNKKCREFRAWVGPDISGLTVGFGHGTVEFLVIGDGKTLWRSGVMRTGDEPKRCIVDLSNIEYCEFIISDAEDGFFFDHASWAEAYFYFEQGSRPQRYARPIEKAEILTPTQPQVHINGPRVLGFRPSSPIVYRIPVSGSLPIQLELSSLPSGLSFDSTQNTLRGSLSTRGEYRVRVQASNSSSKDECELILKIGDSLAYTSLMGWNSWFVTNEFVYRDTILNSLRSILSHRLMDYGYNYINIDAGWQRKRGSDGTIGVSEAMGDMKSLVDTIHHYGLRAGLYTSPGYITCVEDPGSFNYETQDAKIYSEWGFDLLKSDWCSASEVFQGHQTHSDMLNLLKKMGDALKAQPRDILYSICQYGEAEVWSWAKDVGAHYWRTAADNEDNWWMMSVVNGFPNGRLAQYAGTCGWNDYDFLLFGNGRGPGPRRRKTFITPVEQYTHMTLWTIGKSPLIMSFCVTDLDSFSLNLLTNTEVLDIHQDSHPSVGSRVYHPEFYSEVWMNAMSDGSKAVALFNRDNYAAKKVSAPWAALGIPQGKRMRVRDCWRQKDLGFFVDSVSFEVPSHGALLLRLYADSASSVSEEARSESNLRILPNPASSHFELECTSNTLSQARYCVYDLVGKVVLQSELVDLSPGTQRFSVELPVGCSSGVYYVELRGSALRLVQKLVVTKNELD